jgi:hypothetical protein
MNFMITLVGWFLWNWAEFTITKEKGDDGSIYMTKILSLISGTTMNDIEKAALSAKVLELFIKPISFKDYAFTHYETWVGSGVTMIVLLWAMSRQLSLDPFASLIGVSGVPLGWNDIYLLLSGAVWDAFIFGFKWVKNLFKKKEAKL